MAWDESEHPRDSDGKFTDRNGTRAKSRSIRVGEGQPAEWDIGSQGSIYDINSVTTEIESDSTNAARILRQAIAEGRIHYSNKGAHIVPDKKGGNGKN